MIQSQLGALQIIATVMLLTGLADDLRSRKFHNWLFLACTATGLIASIVVGGLPGLQASALGLLAGFFVMLPLVVLRIVGAGDLKLMVAFGTVAAWSSVVAVAFYALFWGAVFGVARVIISGQTRVFVNNLVSLFVLRKPAGLELHKIPYTVALLFGWLTHLTLEGFL